MALMGDIPMIPRPLKVFDADRRKKLLDLANFLLQGQPVESTERTVRFLVRMANVSHTSEPVPVLDWLSNKVRTDFDVLADWDPNHCAPMQRLLPQMRFTARLQRNR